MTKGIAEARHYDDDPDPEPEEEKKDNSSAIAITTIIIAGLLALASFGWLWGNIDEIFGPFFDRDDPTPTPAVTIPTPDGAVEAALYAECQDQLEGVLAGEPLAVSDIEKEANAGYLDEARKAEIRLRDLVSRGEMMFEELRERDGDTPAEYKADWQRRAMDYRIDLYESLSKVRDLGMGEPFTRLHSELFLAYHWLDRYSDQINNFFTPQNIENVSDQGLNRAKGHLGTARNLLNR